MCPPPQRRPSPSHEVVQGTSFLLLFLAFLFLVPISCFYSLGRESEAQRGQAMCKRCEGQVSVWSGCLVPSVTSYEPLRQFKERQPLLPSPWCWNVINHGCHPSCHLRAHGPHWRLREGQSQVSAIDGWNPWDSLW